MPLGFCFSLKVARWGLELRRPQWSAGRQCGCDPGLDSQAVPWGWVEQAQLPTTPPRAVLFWEGETVVRKQQKPGAY